MKHMRQMSKAAKAEAYDRVVRERDLNELVICDLMNGRVMYGAWMRDTDGSRVRCGVSRINGACGGILISQYRSGGDCGDTINVELFEAGEQRISRARVVCESYDALYRAMVDAKRAATQTSEVAA